jgi:hypothetical protein
MGSDGRKGFFWLTVCCESADGTAVCVDVFYVLPVTILHEKVTYEKHNVVQASSKTRVWSEMCGVRRVEFYMGCVLGLQKIEC